MLRVLILLALVGFAVYVVLKLVNQAPNAAAIRTTARRADQALPPIDVGDFEQAAAIATGPDKGLGVLRLTPSQLIFASGSGRIITIERFDITGVSATTHLPDRESAKPVLAVTTPERSHYFAVDDPAAWERRLL